MNSKSSVSCSVVHAKGSMEDEQIPVLPMCGSEFKEAAHVNACGFALKETASPLWLA